uniref:BOS complex subunit NCLN n=1 Tax=Setaria digitata TaxID=48799 RepID=A0A915PEJ6_9BILA
MLDEFLDELRSPIVFVYVSILLTWCVVSSTQLGDSVELEFKAYRLQQYDIIGTPRGSRSWQVIYEAVSLDSNVLRRCLIVNWHDLLGRDLQTLFNQAFGAVLIVLPANLDTLTPSTKTGHFNTHIILWELKTYSGDDLQKLVSLEKSLLNLNTDTAVYVVQQQPELQALVTEVTAFSKRSPTAVQQLLNAISANTFQFSSSTSISNNIVVPKSANVIGHLWSTDRNSPVIVVVAHCDSHSAVPGLAVGADANGSGVAALLELLAIFSRFYGHNTMKPKYNMIFLFTTGGKFNYQGSRQWLEEHIDKQTETNVELVICLDSLGKDNSLIAHVSKMPTETSPVGRFFSLLKNATPLNRTTDVVSKKINLNADVLAWEHERFSIQRLPALTLSHFNSHTDSGRNSFLDLPSQIEMEALVANVRTIGEALLVYVLNLPNTKCTREENASSCSILTPGDVNQKRLSNWLRQFGNKPRPLAGNSDWLVANLRDTVTRYTSGQAVVEPVSLVDISLYGVLEDHLTAHRAKPAVFELLLATIITVYLSALYFVAPMLQISVETMLVKLKNYDSIHKLISF